MLVGWNFQPSYLVLIRQWKYCVFLVTLQCSQDKSTTFLSYGVFVSGRPMLWFSDVWLHIECYLYRRIREAFALT